MNVNRESGKALTVGKILMPLKILAIALLALAVLYLVLACLTDPEISWTVQEMDDGSFAIYPRISPMQRYIGVLPVWSFDFVYDKFDDANAAWSYCNDCYFMMNDHRPFRLEAQYVVEDKNAKISVHGFYTKDGEQVDISRDFPLNTRYFRKSDYGPTKYTEKLIYIPDDVKQARLDEIEKQRAKTEDLKENGTTFRKHRAFYTTLFTVLSLLAIYLLLRYYKKYHPVFTLSAYSSGIDPESDFYYVIPSPKMDALLFNKIHVEPAEHLKKAFSETEKAFDDMKKICESHRDDLPAKFEGLYFPTAEGALLELRGYYTQNGGRVDVDEQIKLEDALFDEAFYPEGRIKPDLSWKWDVR